MLKSCRRVEVMKNVEVVKKSRGRAKKKMLRNRRWHYGGPQLSKEKTSRQKKKTHGKRKNLTAKRKRLTAKEKTSQQNKKPHGKKKRLTAKEKTSQQNKKPHGKKKRHTAKEKKPPSPYALFYAVRTLLFLSPWGYFFRRESFTWISRIMTCALIT